MKVAVLSLNLSIDLFNGFFQIGYFTWKLKELLENV
jgi:hypothetical protein